MFLFTNSQKSYRFSLLLFLLITALFAACNRKPENNNGTTPTDPKDLAMLYLSQNHLDEAAAAFQQAIQNTPGDLSNYISLTRLYLLQKTLGAASGEAQAGLKIKPGNEDLKLLLAEIYDQQNDPVKAGNELTAILASNPKNVKAYYKFAELYPPGTNDAAKKSYLLQVVGLVPANIVPRLELTLLLAGENKTDSARFYLQSIRKIAPGFSDAADAAYRQAASQLDANQPAAALVYLRQFLTLMKITPEYASGMDDIRIPDMHAGYFDFDTNIQVSANGNIQPNNADAGNSFNEPIKFTAISGSPVLALPGGATAQSTAMAITDYDSQGNMYLYSSFLTPGAGSSKSYLLTIKMGSFKECNVIGGIGHDGIDQDAGFADFDNDGYPDLFIATSRGILVYKNQGDGSFSKITDNIGLGSARNTTKMIFADLDQDGDLDLLVSQKGGNRFFRNNGDGTFTENAADMGLSAAGQGSASMDFGDWDGDGDLDILGLDPQGTIQLFNNNRHARFSDISAGLGLKSPAYTGSVVTFGDYNNDGQLDILSAGGPDGKCTLLKNNGGHYQVDETASAQLSNSLKGVKIYDAAFVDYDNDGYQDIVIAGVNSDNSKPGVRLFHNDSTKGFSDRSSLLPPNLLQAYHIGITDFNFDGDEDLFFSGPSGVILARNDGGNANNFVQVQLTGLAFGNSKNNRLGIGAQVELKAGDLYQMKTVRGPLTEFGVGSRTKLDALRIIWPNGVPQTVVDPTRKQRMLEEEQLKGSCPFLFTWDGSKYEFQKDMMWRSVLGMAVAIHGKDTTYAYPDASREYLLIPGERLRPRNGKYSVRITEELWEAVFFDKAALVAVDHPDSVQAYVDERFVAPPYPGRKVYLVAHPHLPLTATDGNGNNLLPAIRKYDFKYVSNFSLGKFQGLTKEHDLILDLGDQAKAESIRLYLRGWIFPTDASINTELTQTSKYKLESPSLQVINKEGKWQTVIPNIGFPMGRDKMMIVDLSGKFLTPNDRRVRIRTTMQIYWDHIFFTTQDLRAPLKMEDLKMVDAQLRYRGYSASYRKGGPYGPQWFDYYQVSKGQKWRDLTGNYTRYGDVLPLLQKGDDAYIIANSGDEITIDYDAASLPALPKGWKRDFLIYSEGWVKDGDLNTAYGQTVDPLPFHKMPSYPYGNAVHYPTDPAHRAYEATYNTRHVTTFDFKNALRLGNTSEVSH